jgi:hypothetical protein
MKDWLAEVTYAFHRTYRHILLNGDRQHGASERAEAWIEGID